MSFLIDPPALYAGGAAYARLAPDSAQGELARTLGAATIGVFWAVSVSLYLNRAWSEPIARLCGASSGRDWMLNSGVFRFDHRRSGRRTHALATALFLTYPLWLALGYRRGLSARVESPLTAGG